MQESEKPAVEFIRLYTKDLGGATNRRVYYFAENKSTNRAIKVTIRYWDTRLRRPRRYTKSYELEPGEIEKLELKSISRTTELTAAVSGARYLC